MDANNLATVFGPNILKSQNPDPLISLGDSALISYVVSLMIAQADFIFKIEYNKQGNRVRSQFIISRITLFDFARGAFMMWRRLKIVYHLKTLFTVCTL